MSAAQRLLGRLDDWLNPIVVKELRQAVNGKFVAATLVVLVLIQLVALGLIIISGGDFSERVTAGRDAFLALQSIMLLASLLFVPLYTGGRLAFERADANVDLLFITTIRPVAIIWGKVFSALVVTILIFSACMPFMVFTYWLRGIDLPSIFVILSLCFIEVTICILLATFIACLPAGRVLKIFLSLTMLLLFLLLFFYGTGIASYFLVAVGVGSRLDSWQFWEPALVVLLISGALIGLLFSLSTALLTPVAANRALPVRIFISTSWIISGVISAVVAYVQSTHLPLAIWSILSAVVFAGALFVAVSERETLGQRVTRSIPETGARRLLAFFFFSGGASGIAWALASSLCTYGAFRLLSRGIPGSSHGVSAWVIGLPLYALCYALTASLLRRRFLDRWFYQKYTWAVGLILLCIGSIVPFLIGFLAFFGNWQSWKEIGAWMVLNPFALGIDDFQNYYLIVAFSWAVVVTALSASWFADQIEPFRAPEAVEAVAQ